MKEFEIRYVKRITGGYEYKITSIDNYKEIKSIRIPEKEINNRDDAYKFIKQYFNVERENAILRAI